MPELATMETTTVITQFQSFGPRVSQQQTLDNDQQSTFKLDCIQKPGTLVAHSTQPGMGCSPRVLNRKRGRTDITNQCSRVLLGIHRLQGVHINCV